MDNCISCTNDGTFPICPMLLIFCLVGYRYSGVATRFLLWGNIWLTGSTIRRFKIANFLTLYLMIRVTHHQDTSPRITIMI
jgi:hypothetical protein